MAPQPRGALNFVPAIAAWWGNESRGNKVAYLVIPSGVGLGVLLLDRQIDDWGSLESGMLFLTGLLITSLFQVFQWGRDAVTALEQGFSDPHEQGRQQRRLEAVDRTYRSIVWATIVALTLSVTLIVISTKASDELTAQDSTAATALVAFVGTHLVLVLVSIINRIFIVTRSDLKHVQDEVRSQRAKRKVSGE